MFANTKSIKRFNMEEEMIKLSKKQYYGGLFLIFISLMALLALALYFANENQTLKQQAAIEVVMESEATAEATPVALDFTMDGFPCFAVEDGAPDFVDDSDAFQYRYLMVSRDEHAEQVERYWDAKGGTTWVYLFYLATQNELGIHLGEIADDAHPYPIHVGLAETDTYGGFATSVETNCGQSLTLVAFDYYYSAISVLNDVNRPAYLIASTPN